jgi:hypothetical protein
MKTKLEQYISSIRKEVEYDYTKEKDVTDWTFYGDGEGDFEEVADNADPKIVQTYIEWCKKQIILAEEYLKE